MGKARQAYVSVKFTRAKKNGSKSHSAAVMATYSGGFSFTEAATDEIDSISLELVDKGDRWIKKWMPKKGDKLEATIVTGDWGKAGEKKSLRCGKFCLDDIEISGPDLSCMINATSVPELSAIRSVERTKTWMSDSLKELSQRIGTCYHLKVRHDYGIREVYSIPKIKQDNEDDLSFLTKVCGDMGLGIKVSSGKIDIYSKTKRESMPPVATIDKSVMLRWGYNSTLVGTHTGAVIKGKSPGNKKMSRCTVGKGNRILSIKGSFRNHIEGAVKACAELNAANESIETMDVTIPADTRIRAGKTVRITGLGRVNGKYFVDKVTHEVDAGSGYTMDLRLHKCQKRVTTKGARFSTKQKAQKNPNDDKHDGDQRPTTPIDPGPTAPIEPGTTGPNNPDIGANDQI